MADSSGQQFQVLSKGLLQLKSAVREQEAELASLVEEHVREWAAEHGEGDKEAAGAAAEQEAGGMESQVAAAGMSSLSTAPTVNGTVGADSSPQSSLEPESVVAAMEEEEEEEEEEAEVVSFTFTAVEPAEMSDEAGATTSSVSAQDDNTAEQGEDALGLAARQRGGQPPL
jgi:hypothetical protein